jgi:hypothetical protein
MTVDGELREGMEDGYIRTDSRQRLVLLPYLGIGERGQGFGTQKQKHRK